jgi:hypothetical protein
MGFLVLNKSGPSSLPHPLAQKHKITHRSPAQPKQIILDILPIETPVNGFSDQAHRNPVRKRLQKLNANTCKQQQEKNLNQALRVQGTQKEQCKKVESHVQLFVVMMKNARQPTHKTDECKNGEEENEGSFGHPFFLFRKGFKSKKNLMKWLGGMKIKKSSVTLRPGHVTKLQSDLGN